MDSVIADSSLELSDNMSSEHVWMRATLPQPWYTVIIDPWLMKCFIFIHLPCEQVLRFRGSNLSPLLIFMSRWETLILAIYLIFNLIINAVSTFFFMSREFRSIIPISDLLTWREGKVWKKGCYYCLNFNYTNAKIIPEVDIFAGLQRPQINA